MALKGSPIGTIREKFITPFSEMREPTLFFASKFTSKPGNRFNTDEVNFDIRREGEPVAVAVTPGSAADVAGPEFIDASKHTTKRVEPANFNPGTTLTAKDVNSRQYGENPFASRDFRVALRAKMIETAAQLDKMNVRAMERMASQVLQTGTVDSIDRAGNVVFSIDYGAQADHFVDAAVPWSNPGADIIADLRSMGEKIKQDSGLNSTKLVCGINVVDYILSNDEIKDRLNFRRADLVSATMPGDVDRGATFHGVISAGPYRFEIWSYNQTFDHEQTGAKTYYLDPNYVIVMSDGIRLDRLTSTPARPFGMDPTLASFNPGRLASSEFDVTPFLWTNERRTVIHLELAMRALMVPVQIDGWGRINTIP